jgi:hypothetical protein
VVKPVVAADESPLRELLMRGVWVALVVQVM